MLWEISTLCQRHFHISNMIQNFSHHLLLSLSHPGQNVLLLAMLLTWSPGSYFKIPSLPPSLLPSLSSLLPYRPHQVLLNLPPKHFSTLFLLGPVSAFLLPKAFPDSQLVGFKGKFNVNLMKLKHLAPPLLRPWEGSGNVFKQSYIFANLLQKIF